MPGLSVLPAPAPRSDEDLGARIRASFVSSYRTYGARRVSHDLLADGLSCGLHRIERLMRVHRLKARHRRRGLDGVGKKVNGESRSRVDVTGSDGQNLSALRLGFLAA